jgi:aminopeptidase
LEKNIKKFAQILVDHSAQIKAGDRVLLESTTAAAPLIASLYELILERGGHPYPMMELPEQQELFFRHANNKQLSHTPIFRKLAYDEFESRIRIHSSTNPRGLSDIDPEKQALRGKAEKSILEAQLRRGAAKTFKWVTTLYPTQAYADEAKMSLKKFQDFVFSAVHADDKTKDPVAYWKQIEAEQKKFIDLFEGNDKVVLRGPNVDLRLSIKGRTFVNAAGRNNMPDGEIYTGPVENSVEGWVHYTYPAIIQGRVVEGIELKFVEGQVFHAKAAKNEQFLLKMLETDKGARYVGEFAVGTNHDINRFTSNILFDEKIGGSFHMALGAGYPETGSKNTSQIHWDMICDISKDSEIVVDNEVVYKNGEFIL